ncbi:MAG: hypothetical protein ACI4PJ_02905 [Acutalibacteraceae bacterium]
MDKKTDFVKKTFKAIKNKFDYATCAGSKFEKKVETKLNNNLSSTLKEFSADKDWLSKNTTFTGTVAGNGNPIVVTVKPGEFDKNRLIKLVKNEVKKQIKANNKALTNWIWDKPLVECNKINDIMEIKISSSTMREEKQ